MDNANLGLNPGSQTELEKQIIDALFWLSEAPTYGVGNFYLIFVLSLKHGWWEWLEGRKVGIYSDFFFIVLNDLLGHFKQFKQFYFFVENWSLRPQPARPRWNFKPSLINIYISPYFGKNKRWPFF